MTYDKQTCLQLHDVITEMLDETSILLSMIELPEEEKQFAPIHIELDKVKLALKNYRKIIERRME